MTEPSNGTDPVAPEVKVASDLIMAYANNLKGDLDNNDLTSAYARPPAAFLQGMLVALYDPRWARLVIKGMETFGYKMPEELPKNLVELNPLVEALPYAVICPYHGRVFLTREEYDRQMGLPDMRWTCPKKLGGKVFSPHQIGHFEPLTCGALSQFDSEYDGATQ